MVGDHQNLNCSQDLTTSLLGIVCHPMASTCCDQHIYEILIFYLHSLRKYERRYKISKMWCFGVVRVTQGHPK